MGAFEINKKVEGTLARAGVLKTAHGEIKTPAYISPATKASVKGLDPERLRGLGSQSVLANTYHLYLQPGSDLVREQGGLHKFMNWDGPIFTDSGGFQVLSLGEAYDTQFKDHTQFNDKHESESTLYTQEKARLMRIDDEGVSFRSHIDGSDHRFTPERSMEIQHDLGADVMLAFDEATSPQADYEYQKEAMERTHAWAKRSLARHNELNTEDKLGQLLFGIAQGGRFEDLRRESAKFMAKQDFDGFAIGGSYVLEDIRRNVRWAVEELNANGAEDKARHLLGVGEPLDLFEGVAQGIDTFDCVAPTRRARNGSLYTHRGLINISNSRFKDSKSPIDSDCACNTCQNYTCAYIHHLFKSSEMLGPILASVHNLHFVTNLVDKIRESIEHDNFEQYRLEFESSYGKT